MILSDGTLQSLITNGELGISPISADSIQPASIDCRLGNHFLVVEDRQMHMIDLNTQIKYRQIESEEIIIPPHSFLLATKGYQNSKKQPN